MLNKAKILKDAQKFVAKSQWDKAIIEYEKLIKESPNDANNHNIVGDLYLKRNDSDNAIDSYKKAAEIFNKSGFTLKAIALYKKVLNIKPDQVDIYLLLGKLNAERGLLGNANESYLAAAAYFSRQGQKGKAIDVYKVLCDLNPDNLALAQKLADLYQSEGYDKEAVSKFIELAEKKIQSGQLNEARELLDKVGPKGSDRFDFKRVLAIYDMRVGRISEAVENLEDARKIDPSDNRIIQLLAEAYTLAERFSESAELVSQLLEKDPNNPELRKQLIKAYLESGNFASAWQEYSSLIEKCVSHEKLEDAESLAKEFLSRKPDSIEALHCLADIQTKTGKEAEVNDIHFRIAGLYGQAGEKTKAENIYRKLIEKDPGNEKARTALASLGNPAAAEVPIEAPEDLPETLMREEEVPGLELSEELEPTAGSLEPSGAPAYSLDLDLDELQPVSAGDEAEAHSEAGVSNANVFEIPDVDFGDIESEMTRDAETLPDEPPVLELEEDDLTQSGELPDVLDFGDMGDEEPQAAEGPEPTAPAAADIYIREGREGDADRTLQKAAEIDPENEALAARLSPPAEEAHAVNELITEEPFEAETSGPDDEMSFAGMMEEHAGAPQIEENSGSFVISGQDEVPAPKEKDDYGEDISEADFYLHQGLKDEARHIYKRVLSADPGNAEVKAKLDSLDNAPREPFESVYNPPSPAIPEDPAPPSMEYDEFDAAFSEFTGPEFKSEIQSQPEAVTEAEPEFEAAKEEDEFFDLAAELKDELKDNEILEPDFPAEVFEDKQLEAVFKEFKRGVEEQLNKEDYETHYNLGIAYKEMGMLDEAVSEFQLAGKDPERTLDCASMLGLCFMEKGEYDKAIDQFKCGLEVTGHGPEEYMGIRFDMAAAYELMDNIASAQSVINGIAKEDPSFRDVKDRLQRLNKIMIERGLTQAAGIGKDDGPKPPPASPSKKSKVSYL